MLIRLAAAMRASGQPAARYPRQALTKELESDGRWSGSIYDAMARAAEARSTGIDPDAEMQYIHELNGSH